MRKIVLLILICICIMMVFISCTIAPDVPTEGVWYCEKLQLVIEFEESKTTVYSYDENLSHMNLQVRDWNDGGFDIICDNEGEIVEIYSGWRKETNNNRFVILLYSKANPDDDFKTQIALDDEEYIFIRVENLEEINQ